MVEKEGGGLLIDQGKDFKYLVNKISFRYIRMIVHVHTFIVRHENSGPMFSHIQMQFICSL